MRQRIQSMSWESRHRAQVEQRLAQWPLASRWLAVWNKIEATGEKAGDFSQTDQSLGAISTSANNRWPGQSASRFRRVWHRTETRTRTRP